MTDIRAITSPDNLPNGTMGVDERGQWWGKDHRGRVKRLDINGESTSSGTPARTTPTPSGGSSIRGLSGILRAVGGAFQGSSTTDHLPEGAQRKYLTAVGIASTVSASAEQTAPTATDKFPLVDTVLKWISWTNIAAKLDTLYVAIANAFKLKVSANDTTGGYLNGKLVASATISLTEGSDGGNETLTPVAIVQMSVTSDANGLKLSGDAASPGNSKLYGTNGSGTKGWYDQPTASTGPAIYVALTVTHSGSGPVTYTASCTPSMGTLAAGDLLYWKPDFTSSSVNVKYFNGDSTGNVRVYFGGANATITSGVVHCCIYDGANWQFVVGGS